MARADAAMDAMVTAEVDRVQRIHREARLRGVVDPLLPPSVVSVTWYPLPRVLITPGILSVV